MSEIEAIRHHQPYSDGIILLRPVTEYDKEAYYQLLDKGSRNGRSKECLRNAGFSAITSFINTSSFKKPLQSK